MIEVLPANIANQIAAGEVVQRPASIVKELMENAIDAGAMRVIVRCVDGGRTLISVCDDGVGMSRDDAPRAFLRHATSKIRKAEDLFNLCTFGFRGEALASIASVAEVELRTRRAADTIGTVVEIAGGETLRVEADDAPKGTSITVKNLFYNIPARRKFLKSDRAESTAVFTEFVRVAMVNPDVEFVFDSNLGEKTTTFAAAGLHQRIVDLTKQSLRKKLLAVDLNTDVVRLSGYVGTPDTATVKSGSAQFMFVNGRFVRSPFLQRAVSQAYDRLIASGSYPSYFLFLELAPASIDVNISPTKTEVKFDDDQTIFHTIYSAVKGCLGRSNVVEAIDFFDDGSPMPVVDIPTYNPSSSASYTMPAAHSGRSYNPFESYDSSAFEAQGNGNSGGGEIDAEKIPFMEILPEDFAKKEAKNEYFEGFQLDDKYIVVRTAGALSIINIARARQRIAYERIAATRSPLVAQYLIAPEKLDLDHSQKNIMAAHLDQIESLGFVVARASAKGGDWELHAVPSGLDRDAIYDVLSTLEESGAEHLRERLAEKLTRGIANEKCGAVADVGAFVEQLMGCDEPSYTASGLKIIELVDHSELDKRMK